MSGFAVGQKLDRYRIVAHLGEGGVGTVYRARDLRLERAFQQRDGALAWLKVHRRLDVLRGEPRFRDLLARMRLEA